MATTKKRRPLGPGHRSNPWIRAVPTANLLVAAITQTRGAHAALLTMARALGTEGICHTCGCTDEAGCEGGCWWVDGRRTLCSHCSQIVPLVRGIRSATRRVLKPAR